MGWAEKAWDAFRDVLRLQDKVQSLSSKVDLQQTKIESLNIEVAQLKMAVTILLAQAGVKLPPKPPFDPPALPGT
jgi:peptidoglycan hydrolase CwlO-like protein